MRLQEPPRQFGDFAARQADAAGGRVDQADDAARHRRFPGAAFTDDAERAALAQGEGNVLGGGDLAGFAEATNARDRLFRARWLPAPPARSVSGAARAARRLGTAESRLRVYSIVGLRRIASSVAGLDQPAVTHHRDAVGDFGDHAHVVGDEEHARCRGRAAGRGSA